jgi:uncharacterized membrane-anchored protein
MRFFFALGLVVLGGCSQVMLSHSNPEMRAAVEAANRTRIDGPADVRLTDGTILALVEGLSYFGAAEGERIMRAMGERPGPGLLGVVVTDAPEPTLIAVIYAKGRNARGMPQVEIVGWEAVPGLRFK